ncbi:MAG: site-specific DNA-methyltransferase [Proteobacteria bacterium]|nr:site-specific DNA-methyltransferase [Pseudomonadota bacterium]MBU2226698.1 site-specific DNA-methyltransferase [Pseudomonadota bacterium]MBU2261255.1 site-specific DNA-methyltransferase [Pseudomonadota bacterium]
MKKRKADVGQAGEGVVDYRHKNVTRLNIPPSGLEARGEIAREKRIKWAYNPHLAPALRFDGTGKSDDIVELIDAAGKRKLEPEEMKRLQEAFRNHEPWLEWAGKREQQWCVADPVALHIHERISTQAILKVARREDIQRDLFADPEHEYREAVQFYKHPMDWTNRMILGDSLAVMASLARREALAGKVQMIYMDPPYGIKYASNFQPEVGRRDVKDRDEDLTREPEMVKAYRDTWTLGVHSYLSYLRDRLLLCKELLADTGSVFVQIGEENRHRVRCLIEEVFGSQNFISEICFVTTTSQTSQFLPTVTDYLLWFGKNRERTKFRPVWISKDRELAEESIFAKYEIDGLILNDKPEHDQYRFLVLDNLTSRSGGEATTQRVIADGKEYVPSSGGWKTNSEGLKRLGLAGRLFGKGNTLLYKRYYNDFEVTPLSGLWKDTQSGGLGKTARVYVVQTNAKVIERCMLMTTDPGDLVLDPTCGSGTTEYVAEQWGRRWITIDVSRVALAIARQRLLTAKFDYYRLRPTSAGDVQRNPDGSWLTDPEGQIPGACTFDCKTVPHVTLKSIAQNQALDPIFDRWTPIFAEKLAALNAALGQGVTKTLRQKLIAKLEDKRKREGKRAVTDADERRWRLPEKGWQEWDVPFDTDPDWPQALQEALTAYRGAWRGKMDEVNACIAARADQEELVDQPFLERNRVRVAGPFTMEGVIPAAESIDAGEPEASPISGAPEELETFDGGADTLRSEAQNTEAYLDRMTRLLRGDGVRFPDNKILKFTMLEALADGSTIHAKGTWGESGEERQAAVIFGPQYGPLTTRIVEEGIRIAARRGFDDLVFAAFSFDAQAQVTIQEVEDPAIKLHMAQIRPDVNMGDLLKTTVSSQLFTVSGSPRTRLEREGDGQYVVHMEGVDIYDPVTNAVRSSGAEKVSAWFLDSDYDGRCFCVCQAFFPDRNAWEKLGKALGGALDEEAFAKLSGTVSLPFTAGDHNRIAVKVIDPRGNEVLRVHKLGEYDKKSQ